MHRCNPFTSWFLIAEHKNRKLLKIAPLQEQGAYCVMLGGKYFRISDNIANCEVVITKQPQL